MSENKERIENGSLLQIQSFSTHDGDGIRTVIFLPGCPLRCQWCANPETWTTNRKLAYYQGKCTHCGTCKSVCPQGIDPTAKGSRTLCVGCGVCASACPQEALSVMCKASSAEDIIKRVQRDEIFYRYSGGGVTYSGGEPTFQAEFLRELVTGLSSQGIDQWLETCGYFAFDKVSDILPKMSHIFYDLKVMDEEKHKHYTGVSNQIILDNAKRIYELKIPMTIRIPSIPGLNLTRENLEQTLEFMSRYLPDAELELLPYHDLGREKYHALQMEEALHIFEVPSEEELEEAADLIRSYGIRLVSYT
ncbi:glycyl-radical enzyme activating protein [Ohessyouella blattaphilus]|uniref:Glycyl-radical enzyme activating protein n=1 Tax=Ohessyouella blattaphilus TaxID=2949333 RepID=A0ABT1EK57_9FIRM|nr:glycyl-radical enzyme activating protein [Ohessyouella blattaphilus]MCP1111073.1 glycyl-radical enzyme activating protein [Ohessyouella blattaphilus]MCR8564467.1 glycyl-radical enzyme activating protein [Ohessyouella blattaphilus]